MNIQHINTTNNLLETAKEFETLGRNERIQNPNDMLFVMNLSPSMCKNLVLQNKRVVITRKAIKHITEQRGTMAEEIIRQIPEILKNPTKIGDNSKKRPRSFLFIKMNGGAKGVVLEVAKTPDGNQVVSAFPIDRKTYQKIKDISGRAAVPPFATP